MFKKNFLNSVVPGMNRGYQKSATGRAKIYPLHAEVNKAIRKRLGRNFSTFGYGGDNEVECTIKSQSGHWKPDGFFGLKSQVSKGILRGGTIDYKAPYSNVYQNIGNVISALRSEAAVVRPAGNLFTGFVMVPETVPYFNSDGTVRNLESPARKFAKDLNAFANSDSSFDGSPDLIGFCAYRLPGLDLSKIKTKDEYTKALAEYNGRIEYVNLEGIKSNGKFIFNNPDEFVKRYSEMVSEHFSENASVEEYMKLFSQTPIEDQIKYLMQQGKLATAKMSK